MSDNSKSYAIVDSEIINYLQKISFNQYTNNLYDIEKMNLIDRKKAAKEFTEEFFYNGYYEIINEITYDELISYVAKQIDRLIPRFFFVIIHKELCKKYTSALVHRIFLTHGKDGFEYTKGFIYHFEQDFSVETENIKKTSVTQAQMQLLNKLLEEQGFQLINAEYLSKPYANAIIKYLNGEQKEPIWFEFFTIINY